MAAAVSASQLILPPYGSTRVTDDSFVLVQRPTHDTGNVPNVFLVLQKSKFDLEAAKRRFIEWILTFFPAPLSNRDVATFILQVDQISHAWDDPHVAELIIGVVLHGRPKCLFETRMMESTVEVKTKTEPTRSEDHKEELVQGLSGSKSELTEWFHMRGLVIKAEYLNLLKQHDVTTTQLGTIVKGSEAKGVALLVTCGLKRGPAIGIVTAICYPKKPSSDVSHGWLLLPVMAS